jgi:predicted ester cyclase
LLKYFYQLAFNADAEIRNTVFADGKAVFEGDFIGKHIGEFAGIPATNRQVRVPLCVVYDLENDLIKRGVSISRCLSCSNSSALSGE